MTDKQLTKQKAFSKVWEHFIINKSPPAINDFSGACAYRTKEGNKCAIGLLLSDDELTFIELSAEKEFGFAICLEEIMETFIGDKFEDKDSYFWLNLQEAHDFSVVKDKKQSGDFTTNMKQWLEKTAKEYRLKISN